MNASQDCQNKSANFTTVLDLYGDYVTIYEAFTIRGSLQRIIFPIWLFLGIPGSIFCIIVWTRPRMLNTSSVYLAALGASDLGLFACQVIWFLKTSWYIDLLRIPVFCEFFVIIIVFFQYLSPLFTSGFTLERFILVCFPFKGERILSFSRSVKSTIAMTIIAFLLSLIQGYFFEYDKETGKCEERKSVIKEGAWQNSLLFYWNLVAETVVFGVIPLGILVLNIFVIKETRILQRKNPTKTKQMERRESKINAKNPANKNASTTAMLLCISFYFILSTLPLTIIQLLIIHNFWNGDECMSAEEVRLDPTWRAHFAATNTKAVLESMAMSHFAAKFVIYMITGKQFRIQFFSLFKRKPKKQILSRRNGTETQMISSENYKPLGRTS